MTSAELQCIAEGARDAIALASPGLAIVVIVAEPDPAASLFSVATNTNAADTKKILVSARVAIGGS